MTLIAELLLMIKKRRTCQISEAASIKNRGQTIVEVLIATLVVATVLTALAAGLTMSVKNTAQSKQRSLAISYAQDSLEIFHREKYALGWESFHEALTNGVYCLNQLPANSAEFSLLSPNECVADDQISGTNFQREAEVTIQANEVTVVSIVSWFDGGTEKQVSVEQTFQEFD